MGIDGLLGALKPFASEAHVKEYANQKVGIDTFCWLHKVRNNDRKESR